MPRYDVEKYRAWSRPRPVKWCTGLGVILA